MSRPDVVDAEVEATLASTLDSLDGAVNYMRWIVDLIRPHLAGPILEVGAGHGTFTAALAELGAVHAVEPGSIAASRLVERFAGDSRVRVTHGVVDDLDPQQVHGSAVMINVLEHIADDVASLRRIGMALEPGARLAIWVPAFPLLFSDFDRRLGHHRRYRRHDLERVVAAGGFRLHDIRYVNMPGFVSWLLIARVLRQAPTDGPLVSIFDRYVVPVVRRIETTIRPPFGQSLLAIAERPVG